MTTLAGLILGILAVLLAWQPSTAGILVLADIAALQYALPLILGPGRAVLLWPELFLIAAGLCLSGGGYLTARRSNADADLAVMGIVTNLVAAALVLLRLLAWGIMGLTQLG